MDVERLRELFASVGFPARDPERLMQAVESSVAVSALLCGSTGEVRAFARAAEEQPFPSKVSTEMDWRSMVDAEIRRNRRLETESREEAPRVVTIWDVAVAPEWQRKGLGRKVIENLLVDLDAKGVDKILLQAEPEAVEFYIKLGFIHDESFPAYPPPLDRRKGMVYV